MTFLMYLYYKAVVFFIGHRIEQTLLWFLKSIASYKNGKGKGHNFFCYFFRFYDIYMIKHAKIHPILSFRLSTFNPYISRAKQRLSGKLEICIFLVWCYYLSTEWKLSTRARARCCVSSARFFIVNHCRRPLPDCCN